jgi:hypothetical protein
MRPMIMITCSGQWTSRLASLSSAAAAATTTLLLFARCSALLANGDFVANLENRFMRRTAEGTN